MKELYSIEYVMLMLKNLADVPYSALWKLTEDFRFNGHILSVQKSNQYKHIIIDGAYYSISENLTVVFKGKEYTALDYVREKLLKGVER